nr:unnamed protein product [Callosobruchus chinensis]
MIYLLRLWKRDQFCGTKLCMDSKIEMLLEMHGEKYAAL